MKKLASILLFLFVLFLITPTVVSAIENDGDISVVSNFSEEEKMENDAKILFLHSESFDYSNHSNQNINNSFDLITLYHEQVFLLVVFSPPEV